MTKLSDYNARAVGIAWIRKEDYLAALAVFEDGNNLPRTWERWEQSAKGMEAKFKADGYIVERVYIDPETFPDWCRNNGVGVNSKGRIKFAASTVGGKYGRNQS